jgi:D-amino-acid dehydrogenase
VPRTGNQTSDVVVVGGGLVGMSLCYELVTRGLSVVLVDRHHEGRATDAGAGILSPETFLDPDDDWASLARSAAEHHRLLSERVAEDGAGGTGVEVCGLIRISTSEPEDEWIATGTLLAERRTPGVVVAIDPSEAVRAFPPLGDVRSALFNPNASRIDGRHATGAVARAAINRGLRNIEGEVTALDLGDSRALGVRTTEGSVAAGAVVIAGGAWSSEFAEQLGTDLPVSPMKGQIIHMRLPGTETGHWPIIQPVFSHYLVPWPEGRVACGGTLEARAGFDTRQTAGGIHELLREGLRTAPGLADATVEHVRVGLRPRSADDRPLLGLLAGWSNVHVATGHGTEGLLLGPYTAALVADSIASGAVAPQIARLSPARFAAERSTPG